MTPHQNSISAPTCVTESPCVLVIAPTQEAHAALCRLLVHSDYTAQSVNSTAQALEHLSDDCRHEARFAAIVLCLGQSNPALEIDAAVANVRALSALDCAPPIVVIAPEDAALDRALSHAGACAFLPQHNLDEAVLERALRYALERHSVEQELRAQASHQSAIAATTPLVMVTISENDIIEYVNPAVETIFGYTPEEIIGRDLTVFMASADAARHKEGMARYLDTGERHLDWRSIEVSALARDGRVMPVAVTFSEYTLYGQRYFAAALRDVSEQYQAQEALRQSEARYAHMAANVPGMIYQFVLHPDCSSYFAFVSEGVRQIYGVSPEEACTNANLLHAMVHPDDRDDFFRHAKESAHAIKPWTWIGRILRHDGQVRWVEVRAQPTPQPNGNLLYDGMMLDVTARRNAEIELEQAHIELENRVAQRTQELAQTNGTLQDQIAARLQIEANIRRHARQQEALAHLSQSALSDIELPVFLRDAVALVAATMNAQFSNISQLDASGQHWLTPYTVGWPADISQYSWPLVEGSALHQVLKTGIPVVIDDWHTETRWTLPQRAQEEGVISTIYVRIPGASGGENVVPYGILAAHSRVQRQFSIDDIQFLQAMANIIATTLQRRQLNAELLETSQRLKAVLDNASAIIFIKDLQGRYVLANKRLEELHRDLRPTAPPLLGHNDAEYMPPATAAKAMASDQFVIAEKCHQTFEISFEHHKGTQHFLTTKFPLFDEHGQISGIGGVSTDITDRKEAELARETSRREAEQARVEADRARREADRANRAKSEFLSRMSHELRTPLNAIIGFAQLLELSELPPRSEQGVQQILRAGRHLLTLINEVLDMASIEAGRLSINLQTVASRPILDEVLDLLLPLAAQNQVSLLHDCSGDCNTPIVADPQRVMQILLNLVSNAIKYNQPQGEVVLSCRRSGSETNPRLQISVRDTGQGIAPENIARLWQPFDRLDAKDNAIEGTGLGLTLSRSLAQSMNGTLDAISTLGEGSTFWIELPIAAPLSQ